MGTITKGILGGFSGRVGTVVGANWRGKDVMRSLPKHTNHVPSASQLVQRMKFSVVIKFLSPIKLIVGAYFGKPQNPKSRMNLAVSYHLKHAMVLVNEAYKIDYPEVLISKGDLPGLQIPTATALAGNKIELTWEDNSDQGLAEPTDRLYVVCYCEDLNRFAVFDNVTNRDDEEAEVRISNYFAGLRVEVWATFIATDGHEAATSSYLGPVMLI